MQHSRLAQLRFARAALAAAAVCAAAAGAPASLRAQPARSDSAPDPRPGHNRLFFAPTGRTLPRGTREAGAYQIVAPYVGYAFHDRIMLAAGTPILPEVFGRLWYLAPKVGLVRSRMLNAAVGGLVLFHLPEGFVRDGVDDRLDIGSLAWAALTFGTPAAAVSIGAAAVRAYRNLEPAAGFAGFEYRFVGGRERNDVALTLIGEAYFSLPPRRGETSNYVLAPFGVRFSDRRVAMDFAIPIERQNGRTRFNSLPLFHASVFF